MRPVLGCLSLQRESRRSNRKHIPNICDTQNGERKVTSTRSLESSLEPKKHSTSVLREPPASTRLLLNIAAVADNQDVARKKSQSPVTTK